MAADALDREGPGGATVYLAEFNRIRDELRRKMNNPRQ